MGTLLITRICFKKDSWMVNVLGRKCQVNGEQDARREITIGMKRECGRTDHLISYARLCFYRLDTREKIVVMRKNKEMNKLNKRGLLIPSDNVYTIQKNRLLDEYKPVQHKKTQEKREIISPFKLQKIFFVVSLEYGGTGPTDWPEKWKKAFFVGLNRQDGQFAARLAKLMVMSHHEIQRLLGLAAMVRKLNFIQVMFLRAHSHDKGSNTSVHAHSQFSQLTQVASVIMVHSSLTGTGQDVVILDQSWRYVASLEPHEMVQVGHIYTPKTIWWSTSKCIWLPWRLRSMRMANLAATWPSWRFNPTKKAFIHFPGQSGGPVPPYLSNLYKLCTQSCEVGMESPLQNKGLPAGQASFSLMICLSVIRRFGRIAGIGQSGTHRVPRSLRFSDVLYRVIKKPALLDAPAAVSKARASNLGGTAAIGVSYALGWYAVGNNTLLIFLRTYMPLLSSEFCRVRSCVFQLTMISRVKNMGLGGTFDRQHLPQGLHRQVRNSHRFTLPLNIERWPSGHLKSNQIHFLPRTRTLKWHRGKQVSVQELMVQTGKIGILNRSEVFDPKFKSHERKQEGGDDDKSDFRQIYERRALHLVGTVTYLGWGWGSGGIVASSGKQAKMAIISRRAVVETAAKLVMVGTLAGATRCVLCLKRFIFIAVHQLTSVSQMDCGSHPFRKSFHIGSFNFPVERIVENGLDRRLMSLTGRLAGANSLRRQPGLPGPGTDQIASLAVVDSPMSNRDVGNQSPLHIQAKISLGWVLHSKLHSQLPTLKTPDSLICLKEKIEPNSEDIDSIIILSAFLMPRMIPSSNRRCKMDTELDEAPVGSSGQVERVWLDWYPRIWRQSIIDHVEVLMFNVKDELPTHDRSTLFMQCFICFSIHFCGIFLVVREIILNPSPLGAEAFSLLSSEGFTPFLLAQPPLLMEILPAFSLYCPNSPQLPAFLSYCPPACPPDCFCSFASPFFWPIQLKPTHILQTFMTTTEPTIYYILNSWTQRDLTGKPELHAIRNCWDWLWFSVYATNQVKGMHLVVLWVLIDVLGQGGKSRFHVVNDEATNNTSDFFLLLLISKFQIVSEMFEKKHDLWHFPGSARNGTLVLILGCLFILNKVSESLPRSSVRALLIMWKSSCLPGEVLGHFGMLWQCYEHTQMISMCIVLIKIKLIKDELPTHDRSTLFMQCFICFSIHFCGIFLVVREIILNPSPLGVHKGVTLVQ
ncbi:hypothetical protein VP01_1889g1 [Puccinia sorghi]|uniref:Uncharacterized protein n=1 Tax=Puccinia sorghi TaxID=27349 RepID=A0A0L6VD42_9BASI|nr:hypothetical protein VP01_1889g1 [Puccinia sorghi]